MTHHVYKTIDLVGTSETGIEDAISAAITKAAGSVRHLRWFEVTQVRGHIENGRVAHYQVAMRVSFTLEDAEGDAG